MNRVIKFRAWDKFAKIMRDDGTHPNGNPHMKYDVGIMSNEADNEWATGIDGLEIRIDSKSFEIMQFTGLKDKNGKDIYEGDVVHCSIDGDNVGNIDMISFKNGSFWLRYRDRSVPSWIEFGNELEVIGNICEHPHLLK